MGINYSIYLKQPDAFCALSFEQYCQSINLDIKVHPSFVFFEDDGFLPIRLVDARFSNGSGNNVFLSGFEIFSSEYCHISPTRKKSIGFLSKLFKPKPTEETPFDSAIKNSKILIDLYCGNADSFEVMLAYAFSSYLVKFCNGIFYDPQSGQFCENYSHLEDEIEEIVKVLQNQANTGELLTHKFNEWL